MSNSTCPSDPDNPLSCCSTRLGLTFIAQSAFLSFIAVVCLLAYACYIAFKNRHTQGWRLIRSHLDLYLLGLLLSDLIQSIAGIMDIQWIARAGVHEGKYCTVQGVFLQFGDVGVALCSSAIAVHTFAELVLRWKEPQSFRIPIAVLCLYAVFLTLIIGLGYAVNHRKGVYYGNTTIWCWIKPRFLHEGIGLEYTFLWTAALVNIVVYVPIFLALAKIIIVEQSERWWGYRVRRPTPEERKVSPTQQGVVKPRRMLFYPLVYIVTVLPIAVARIPKLAHPSDNVPFAATVFTAVLFSASGIFNVLVYTSTRPALLRPSAATHDSPRRSRSLSHAPHGLVWSDADAQDTDASDSQIGRPERQSHEAPPNGSGHKRN